MSSIQLILNKIKDGSIHEMWEEFKWMFSYGKNYRSEILFYIFLGIFSTIMTLLSSIASKELIDIVTGHQSNRMTEMAILMISMALFSLLFSQLMSRITLKINLRIQNEIQADIFNKMLQVNWSDLQKYPSGDLLNRFINDVRTVAASAIGWLPNLIVQSFNFIATLGLILYYDPSMFILTIINMPILLLSSKLLMRKMREHNMKIKKMNSDMMNFEMETFSNMDSIKSFNLMDYFHRRLINYQEHYKTINLDYNWYTIKANTLLSIIGMIVQYSFYGWAVYRLWSGAITYGEMTLFLTQSARMSKSFSSLVGIIPATVTSTISASRLIEILGLPKENLNIQQVNHLYSQSKQGFTIRLENVDFSYDENKNVLVSSSMYVHPGEIIALVGPSGEGKTTMVRMFLGLIAPKEGKAVLIDSNKQVYDLDASTRHLFAYVPQGNTIFSGTICDNLRMVKEDATEEEMIQALKSACAYSFVEKMEKGIYSDIGSKGRGLSEGQAQRLAIARAILKQAPILLLDEATSALDPVTEKEVLQNIMINHPQKTCIVTTHRPSVLHLCQRVYRVMNAQLNEVSPEDYMQMALED